MKIYTKKGDKGESSLLGGTRVRKDNIRLEAYGTVDELNAYIGHIHDQEINKNHKAILLKIQNQLFNLGSLLSFDGKKSKIRLPEITKENILDLENEIDKMEKELPPLTEFILPCGHTIFSLCQITRAICRRAERNASKLKSIYNFQDEILIYLNRLSDYMFVIARKFSIDLEIEEIPWKT